MMASSLPQTERPQAMHQLRAPREDRGRVIEPPLADASELLAANEELKRRSADYSLQGRSLRELSRQARQELVAAAWEYTRQYRESDRPSGDRLVLAGHQPELFHAGVWYKNFVLDELAREQGAAAVNLVIDSDTVKHVALRVPGGAADAPSLNHVAYDRAAPAVPFEERAIAADDVWNSFGRRGCETIGGLISRAMLRDFWPDVLARSRATRNLGECLAQTRHQWEARFGLNTLELPQSRVCDAAAFQWFVVHCLANLPRLWSEHNAALSEYRRAHGLRSNTHPVPDLSAADGWLEAPFWLWSQSDPKRRALFARRVGDELEISDRAAVRIRLAVNEDADGQRAVEQLADARRRGMKLRTRALTTTLWARLTLCDLFLHGIGGAKYDLLTDEIWRRFFGCDPPRFMAASATLKLPLPRPGVNEGDLRRIDQQLRELRYHPEQHLNGAQGDRGALAAATAMIEEKRRWIATPQTADTVGPRYHALRQLNDKLQPFVSGTRKLLEDERRLLAIQLKTERVLGSREFAFCLFPEATLRDFLLEFPAGSR